MNSNFYDSELVIKIIKKYCNNPDDLKKIMTACECLYEYLNFTPAIPIPPLNAEQLISRDRQVSVINN